MSCSSASASAFTSASSTGTFPFDEGAGGGGGDNNFAGSGLSAEDLLEVDIDLIIYIIFQQCRESKDSERISSAFMNSWNDFIGFLSHHHFDESQVDRMCKKFLDEIFQGLHGIMTFKESTFDDIERVDVVIDTHLKSIQMEYQFTTFTFNNVDDLIIYLTSFAEIYQLIVEKYN